MYSDCHGKGELVIAIKLLKAALKNHRDYFTDQHANTLCELLIMTEKFTEVLEVGLNTIVCFQKLLIMISGIS